MHRMTHLMCLVALGTAVHYGCSDGSALQSVVQDQHVEDGQEAPSSTGVFGATSSRFDDDNVNDNVSDRYDESESLDEDSDSDVDGSDSMDDDSDDSDGDEAEDSDDSDDVDDSDGFDIEDDALTDDAVGAAGRGDSDDRAHVNGGMDERAAAIREELSVTCKGADCEESLQIPRPIRRRPEP